ncbi:MAG: aminoacyl-tRNA hydrolase [Akkermansia sp.]|nr:aminoacyl-tRNA hydrolase [Akkermansia sp.]
MRIIAGLGNPGRDYAETRHNVGFMVLDRLAHRFGAEWKLDKARKGELAAGPGVLLIKPQTFMNSSGECVGPIMRYYKFEPEQVLVIYDDISFPVGTMRLRAGGSAGGHNGMKSLIAHLGGEKFPRLRVGIGAPGQKEMVGHVLGKFAPDERPLLEECLAKAEEATVMMIKEGFQAAANKFNVKKEKKPRKKQESAEEPPAPEAAPAE